MEPSFLLGRSTNIRRTEGLELLFQARHGTVVSINRGGHRKKKNRILSSFF